MTDHHHPSAPRLAGTVVLGLGLLVAGAAPIAATAAPAGRQAAVALDATLRPSGDTDGSGSAHVRLLKERRKVCAAITWQDIAAPNAAHIHQRSDGAVVVDLTGAVTGGARCATGVSRRLIGKLAAHPRRYYVNVHNTDFPAGAIQGRLHG